MTSPRAGSPTGTSSIPFPRETREIPSQSKPKVLLVFGTRPEAIKLAPVVAELQRMHEALEVVICVTAQHRLLLDQALRLFELRPNFDLDLMEQGQTPTSFSARALGALEPVLATVRPDLTVVQGDTTTAFCAALASFYAGIPVAHVEAGLRTFDLSSPFPEEMNRTCTTRLAALHFAPTEWAAGNLVRSGVPQETIHVTGNTGIDAVLYVANQLKAGVFPGLRLPLDERRKLIVVTAHRRENFGKALERICDAVAELAGRGDVEIVWPVHPNPNIQPFVHARLGRQANIHLIEPLEYASFIDLLGKAYLVLTDAGGIQEEGPSLGKPILVLRDTTERPEALAGGTVKLVGSDPERIVREAARLLDDDSEHQRMSQVQNPYGDGKASGRIAGFLKDFLERARHQ